jgi:pyridoxine 5-phosphate synthase
MQTVRTGVNLELAAASDVLGIACELRPMAATLVPERREEITTEGGLELEGSGRGRGSWPRWTGCGRRASARRSSLRRTSVVIDAAATSASTPSSCTLASSPRRGGCARSGRSRRGDARARAPAARSDARPHARTSTSTPATASPTRTWRHVASIGEIEELNIGHSVVSRAVLVGMERAVREMKEEQPPIEPPAVDAGERAVPIEGLTYSGDAALERALALREVIDRATAHDPVARDVVDELFDLIRLARR